MNENQFGVSLSPIQGCLIKLLSSTHYILQKSCHVIQNSLLPIAIQAKVKGVISKIFLVAHAPDLPLLLHAKVFNIHKDRTAELGF